MAHGIVDVFAYQEALLIEAVFGIVLLAMLWVGFRRWLQHKDRMSRLMAEQTAELRRVEARLQKLEQIPDESGNQTTAQIAMPGSSSLPDPDRL